MTTHPFRLDGNRAYIPLAQEWANPDVEATLMHWLGSILHPSCLPDEATWRPPGRRDTPYRWQLDSSNNWWASIEPIDLMQTDECQLILAARYPYQPLNELATWVAAAVGPRP